MVEVVTPGGGDRRSPFTAAAAYGDQAAGGQGTTGDPLMLMIGVAEIVAVADHAQD